MSDDKRFEATPSRLARARREGEVARSQDLGAVAAFGAAVLALSAMLAVLATAARFALTASVQAVAAVGHGGATGAFDGAVPEWTTARWPYAVIAGCVGIVLAAALGGGLGASYLQTRTFTLRLPPPSLAKLNAIKGLGRMFGRDAALGAAKAAFVSAAVAVALVPAVRNGFAPALGASPGGLAALTIHAVRSALAGAIAVAFLFACSDVMLERFKWKRRLRMSFDELRRDHKASDGDPLLRGRRRQRHRALIRGAVSRVRDAAFVVANPTHVAVALEYAPPEIAVPRILVRALDEGAIEVKRLARACGVPIVENIALARALLATTDVGDFIPADTYGAIATIVAMLVRSGALRQHERSMKAPAVLATPPRGAAKTG